MWHCLKQPLDASMLPCATSDSRTKVLYGSERISIHPETFSVPKLSITMSWHGCPHSPAVAFYAARWECSAGSQCSSRWNIRSTCLKAASSGAFVKACTSADTEGKFHQQVRSGPLLCLSTSLTSFKALRNCSLLWYLLYLRRPMESSCSLSLLLHVWESVTLAPQNLKWP